MSGGVVWQSRGCGRETAVAAGRARVVRVVMGSYGEDGEPGGF